MGVLTVRIGSPAPRNLGRENSASAAVYILSPRSFGFTPAVQVRPGRSDRTGHSGLAPAVRSGSGSPVRFRQFQGLAPAVQVRRNSESASFKSFPPAAIPELASSPTMSATDSTSSTPLGGFTVLPTSTSSSGSYP